MKLIPGLLLVLCFFCAHGRAEESGDSQIQEPVKKNVSLQQCIDIALQNHPDIFVSKEDRLRSAAEYRILKGTGGLNINAELRTYPIQKASSSSNLAYGITGVDTAISLFAGLNLTYPLYNARNSRMIEQSRVSLDLSKTQSQKTVNDLVYNVKNAYYLYQMALENLDSREKILKKNEDKLAIAKKFFERGQRPSLDVAKAQVGLNEAQLELEKARNNERQTRIQLITAMGLEDKGFSVGIQKVEEINPLELTLEQLYKLGEANSADIRIMRIQKKIARINIEVERAYSYPDVSVGFSYGFLNSSGITDPSNAKDLFVPSKWKSQISGAIQAKFPLYTGGALTARVDKAKAEYNKLAYKERDLLLNVRNLIRTYNNNIGEYIKQVKLADLMRKNAEKNLAMSKRSYESGVGTMLELQDAELSVLNADLGYHLAVYNYLSTLAKLVNIVGLGEEELCKK